MVEYFGVDLCDIIDKNQIFFNSVFALEESLSAMLYVINIVFNKISK